jgi:hypothetical protein
MYLELQYTSENGWYLVPDHGQQIQQLMLLLIPHSAHLVEDQESKELGTQEFEQMTELEDGRNGVTNVRSLMM